MSIFEKVEGLIKVGDTEDALDALEQHTSDAVLLRSRVNGIKRQFAMGLVDEVEYLRTLAQVNYATLEMASQFKNTEYEKS